MESERPRRAEEREGEIAERLIREAREAEKRESEIAERLIREVLEQQQLRRAQSASGPINVEREQQRQRVAEESQRRLIEQQIAEATVRDAAAPAKVDFIIETRMFLGTVYDARLEILRKDVESRISPDAKREISVEVKVLNKARAEIESAHLKVERKSDEWQDVPPGTRGLWLWRVEPIQPGTAHLVVTVQHAATINGVERRWTVDHFPRTIEIEVGWFHSLKTTWASWSTEAVTIATIVSGLVAVGGAWLALRDRRKPKKPKRAAAVRKPRRRATG